MKLLVFSDNHRDRNGVKIALGQNPGLLHNISLGDSEMKESELTEMNIYGVKGNYPFEPHFPNDLTMVFNDLKVYLTHGHLYSVKLGLTRLLNYAKYNDVDIVLFGHTHNYLIKEIDGVIFVNPGSLSTNKLFHNATYALLDIEDDHIEVLIKNIKGKTIEQYKKNR